MRRFLLLCLALLLSGFLAALEPRSAQGEIIELFNGRDLSGWQGHEKYWSVRDGVIVGKNREPVPVSTYLLSERKFRDFRVVCDFKLAESEMHSGISLWGAVAPDRGDKYTYAGHLVMFPSGYGFYDLYGRNGIHKNADTARKVGLQHDWNHVEILAVGDRIRFALNGVLISDWREPEPNRIREAPIGLQLHSNKVPQEVQFKNVVVETDPADRLVSLITPANPASPLTKTRLYVGTYTGKLSKGIYRVDLDLTTGKFSAPELAAEVTSPSFLTLHPSGKLLYSVNEISNFKGEKAGGASAFAIDAATGDLKLLNQQSSQGTGPCHIACDSFGKHVVIANYGGGSTTVLPIRDDGSLGEASSFVQHATEPKPHAHSATFDAWNRHVVVADLGLDQLLVYRFDPASGKIAANSPAGFKTATGAGPRHFAFHPSGRFGYVINERNMTVTALGYNAAQGVFTELQTIATIPGEVQKGYSTAEVVCHPSGRFLYGSNRGQNSIVCYRIDQQTGKLTLIENESQGISTPRNFNIDPTGQFAVVANQSGDNLALFRVDPQTGALNPTGEQVTIGAPVCVKFLLQ